jgi:YgiT-type zinc finger domain-containing protein
MKSKLQISRCPTCGSDKIKRVVCDIDRKYKGQTYTVPAVEFYQCANCGEKVYDREAMLKIEACSPAYHRVCSSKASATGRRTPSVCSNCSGGHQGEGQPDSLQSHVRQIQAALRRTRPGLREPHQAARGRSGHLAREPGERHPGRLRVVGGEGVMFFLSI